MNKISYAWEQTVKENPLREAIFIPGLGKNYSFNDINQLSEIRCAQLSKLCDLRNKIVILARKNSLEWIVDFITLMKLDAVCVPVEFNQNYSKEEAIDSISPVLIIQDEIEELKFEEPFRFRTKELCVGKLTSGSTGRPKLYFFKDSELLADVDNICQTMGIAHNDYNYAVIPFGHSYGLGNLIGPFISHSIPIIIASSILPHNLASEVQLRKSVIIPSVPVLLKSLYESDINPHDLENIRLIISAGSPLKKDLAHKFHEKYQKIIHNFYGSSETGGIAYDRTGHSIYSNTLGRALEGVDIRETATGRISIESEAVHSYKNANTSKINSNSRFIAQDKGYLNEFNELVLSGRAETFIKIAGIRFGMRNLEKRICDLDNIENARVFLTANDDIHVAIESFEDKEILKPKIKYSLPRKIRPKKIHYFNNFPVTSRGKIDYVKLKELCQI